MYSCTPKSNFGMLCGDTNMYNDDPEDPAVELEEQSTMNSFFAMFSEGEEDSPNVD